MTKKTIATILIVIMLFTTAGTLAVFLPKNASGGSASLSASTSNNKFDTLNGELNSYISKVQTLETEKKVLSDLYDEKTVAYNQLLSDYNSTTDVLVSARKELIQLTLDMEEKDEEIERLKLIIEELSTKIQELQKEYEELQNKYTNATLNYDTLEQLLKGELTTLYIPDGVKTLSADNFIKSNTITNIYLNEVEDIYGDIFTDFSLVDLDLMNVKTLYSDVILSASNSIISNNLEKIFSLSIFNTTSNILDLSNVQFLTCYVSKDGGIDKYIKCSSNFILKFPKQFASILSTSLNNNYCFYYSLSAKYVEINEFISCFNDGNVLRYVFWFSNLVENVVLNNNRVYSPEKIYYQNSSTGKYGDVSSLKIYVPDELVEEYKTTEVWTPYADCFCPMSEKPEGIDTVEYYENA